METHDDTVLFLWKVHNKVALHVSSYLFFVECSFQYNIKICDSVYKSLWDKIVNFGLLIALYDTSF